MNTAVKEVQVIKATKTGEKTEKIRVAAYCRVSTDKDDQLNSFFAQMRYYRDYVRGNDKMVLVDIYADEGITGTELAKRDEMKRLIRDCKHKKIDRVLVKSVTRFARNSLECIETIRTMQELIAGLSSHEGDLSLSLELEEKEVEIEEPIYEDLGSILPCYHAYTWGDELDESVEEAVSYSVPHRFLIEKLNMVQINDGVWAIGNEIVCVDFSLVKNSNLEGLYIKQSVLEKVLQEGYSMVWIGLGEKDFSDGSNNFDSLHYRRSNLSSLIYESKEGKLIEIMYTEAN